MLINHPPSLSISPLVCIKLVPMDNSELERLLISVKFTALAPHSYLIILPC